MGFTVLVRLDLDDISSLYSVNYLLCCSLNRLSSQGNPYTSIYYPACVSCAECLCTWCLCSAERTQSKMGESYGMTQKL